MSHMFITGTNTDVGKSIVTGLIARHYINNHHSIVTQKWIQTGAEGFSADIQMHWKLMGRNKNDYSDYLTDICPYHFKLPASAHLAAKQENKEIDIDVINASYSKLKQNFKHVLVEGSGGLMMPINEQLTSLDLVKALKLPVLIVFSNELGAINHTLLTIEQCRQHNLEIIGIVGNQIKNKYEDALIIDDNPKIIEKLSGIKVLANVPYFSDIKNCPKNYFIDLKIK